MFLLVSIPLTHDFWSVEDPDQPQAETTNVLKTPARFDAALLSVAISGAAWPWALNITL